MIKSVLRILFLHAGTQVLDLQSERAMGGVPTVKGFATIDHVCLINIEGTGMVGVPGETAGRGWRARECDAWRRLGCGNSYTLQTALCASVYTWHSQSQLAGL